MASQIRRLLLTALLLLPLAACEELGRLDPAGGLGGGTTGDVVGEVQYVDTSARQIELRDDAGRARNVSYDDQTRVIYRQRNYAVTNLEPGDYVALRTRQDRDGRLYTDTITVRDSAQDRGYTGAITAQRGTVLRNDPRYNSILLETPEGRQISFTYDSRTRVRYRNRDYPMQNLQDGDVISVRMDKNQLAELITVNRTAQDKASSSASSRLDRLEGTVEFVDSRRGQFEIRDSNNRLVTVNMFYNPPRAVVDRFNNLRKGDRVRVEGHFINQDRFELENFV